MYLQKRIPSEETVKAKIAFEAYSKLLGVRVLHYHADNGRFADNAFLKSVAASGQTISFCGVNAHFQNGRAEKRIRDLQDLARTQLIHAKHCWPTAVEAYLWPYAVCYANIVHNSTTTMEGQPTPIELFCAEQHSSENHTLSSVCMSCLHFGQSIANWKCAPKVGSASKGQSLPRTITLTCQVSFTGVEHSNWHGFPTVPRAF